MTERVRNLSAAAALAAAGALWGMGFPLGKVAFLEVNPATVVLYRFLIASVVLSPVVLRHGPPRSTADRLTVVVAALLSVPLTFTLQFIGLQYTSAANAALIMGAATPMLAVAAVLFNGERLHPGGWVAVAASAAGVGLIAGRPEGRGFLGDGLVLLSAVTAVGGILLSKSLLERYSALVVTAWTIALGTIIQLPLTIVMDGWLQPPHRWETLAALVGMGCGCSALSYLLYNWGLRQVGAARASVYLNLEPVVGALLGVGFLGERLSTGGLMGGALVVAAAVYISLPTKPPTAEGFCLARESMHQSGYRQSVHEDGR